MRQGQAPCDPRQLDPGGQDRARGPHAASTDPGTRGEMGSQKPPHAKGSPSVAPLGLHHPQPAGHHLSSWWDSSDRHPTLTGSLAGGTGGLRAAAGPSAAHPRRPLGRSPAPVAPRPEARPCAPAGCSLVPWELAPEPSAMRWQPSRPASWQAGSPLEAQEHGVPCSLGSQGLGPRGPPGTASESGALPSVVPGFHRQPLPPQAPGSGPGQTAGLLCGCRAAQLLWGHGSQVLLPSASAPHAGGKAPRGR